MADGDHALRYDARRLRIASPRFNDAPHTSFPFAASLLHLKVLRSVLAAVRQAVRERFVPPYTHRGAAYFDVQVALQRMPLEARFRDIAQRISAHNEREVEAQMLWAIADWQRRRHNLKRSRQRRAKQQRERRRRSDSSVIRLDAGSKFGADDAQIVNFVRENMQLVRSLTGRALQQCSSVVERGLAEGLRHEEIAAQLQDRLGVAEARAALIARDQANKLNGRLTQARQQRLGVSRYRWSTSQDERVRKSHALLNGTIQRWDDPPFVDGAYQNPGSPIQCRCGAIAIVDDVFAELGLIDPDEVELEQPEDVLARMRNAAGLFGPEEAPTIDITRATPPAVPAASTVRPSPRVPSPRYVPELVPASATTPESVVTPRVPESTAQPEITTTAPTPDTPTLPPQAPSETTKLPSVPGVRAAYQQRVSSALAELISGMSEEQIGFLRSGYRVDPVTLEASVAEGLQSGTLKPLDIDVYLFADETKYELVDGRHRLAALQNIGAENMPVHIRFWGRRGGLVGEVVTEIPVFGK